MASSLSEEEFHRMQLQLLELRTANYELESKCKKQERDIGILRETAENGDKELQKALKAINRSKKAKEVEILLQENDGLQLKLQSQEEDFRLQNQTLMQELSQLVDANEELEKRCKDTEQSRVGEVQVKPADTLHLEDEIRRLQAQNTALQRNISEEREKNDESDSDSIETLTKTIDDLKLNLDTEQEEKRILKEELASKEAKLTSECSSLKDELGKVTEKLKKKQESFLHLQEEKESLFKDTSAKYEELRASKDRDQKYYSDQITKLQAEIHRLEQNDANVASQQEVEKYQFQVNELRSRMVSLTQQRDDLDTQLQESKKASEEAIEQLRAITKDRDTQIQALQEADKVAEKRKKLLDDLAIKYQKDCDKNREDLLRMEYKYEEDLKVLRKKLEEEKRTSTEFEKQKQTLEDSQAQITSLEHSKSWLERRLAETEDTLKTTVEENKVTVDSLTSQHEEEVDRLNTTHTELTENLTSSYEEKLKECKTQEESQQKTIVHLQEDNKRLQQEIKDGENDKKIHEKKGKSVLKDLKKQLHAERKRAEKLQDRLQQVLSENGRNTSIDDLFRASEMNDSWREDRSSVSSWSAGASGTGTYASFNTSTMSSSPQSPVIDSPTAQNGDTIEQENTELLSRLAGLQQEKWNLEEKVRHLETSTAAMADDLIEKSRIIEHYVMESRTDTKPHPIVHDEKISLKKVLDMVNKSDDQGLKDMNKKLQNMLEETLTKNMHLQKDLETLSEEIVRLSKLESVVVNKNSTKQLNKNSPDQTLCSSSDQSVSTVTSLSSSDNVQPENMAISES